MLRSSPLRHLFKWCSAFVSRPRNLKLAVFGILTTVFLCPLPNLHAEIDTILETAAGLDDASFCQVIRGVRQGIKGREITLPDSFGSWLGNVRKRTLVEAWHQSVLLGVSLGDEPSIGHAREMLDDQKTPPELWRELAGVLSKKKVVGIVESLLRALDNEELQVDAIRGLNRFDDPPTRLKVTGLLLDRIDEWPWRSRNEALHLLASQRESAIKLCNAIQDEGEGKVSRQEVPAFVIRKMRSLNDPEVNHLASEVWGELNATPGDKKQKIIHFTNFLVAHVLDSADLKHGKELVSKLCLTCHQLHGEGQQIGPNLTGAQRGDLYYVLHNIIHPSAEIDRSMRLSVIELENGRSWSGIVTRENDKSVDLQTATEKITIAKSDIEVRTTSEKSMMPEGILDALSNEEVRDLIAYLMADKR